MAGVNKVILLGYVGKPPVIRQVKESKVANFSLATTENYKDKSGQRQSKTEWHNIVAWGNLASLAEKYITKGKQLYIEGKIQSSSWEKDGQKHYRTDINANQIQFVGSKDNGNRNDNFSGDVKNSPVNDDDDIPW